MQETAINIAFATSLLRTDMTQYIVNVDSAEVVELEEAGRKEVRPAQALCMRMHALSMPTSCMMHESGAVQGLAGCCCRIC